MFRSELQRVGAEGAKVLRLLGSKVENMEKLGPGAGDILKEVHDAAEHLQKKIDQRSYLLVNSESWEIGRQVSLKNDNYDQEQEQHILDHNNSKEQNDNNFRPLCFKSLSEAVLNLGPLTNAMARTVPSGVPRSDQTTQEHCVLTKQTSWPSQLMSFSNGDMGNDIESKTYESASAMSLATFASLLIEFVARLQNVVDSFQELSVKADFKDPIVVTTPNKKNGSGIWDRLCCCFRFKG